MIRFAALAPVAGVLLLGACSLPDPVSSIFSGRDSGQSPSERRYEQLSRAGVPSVLAGVENEEGRFAAFLKLQERNGIGTWVSPDNVSLSLWNGFLVATRGLGGDIMSADVGEVQAAILFGFPGYYPRFQSYLDGENQTVIRSFVCKVSSRGTRQVDLGPFTATTRLMEEDCKSSDQSFVNLYWVDEGTGEVRQSRQWASPLLGPIALRQIPR
ncbi:YjbF family lipoprotein [Mangrovicoccus sp. HB161399]|uniref:YjbF family lipoprotein n=1 Tax=Mangrovicoccus sp. HB161399 TaxID=2720392 RepID=UPI001553B92C|nr:YjbF family lipoprotein [Mangrovicoccus sp. HB161399]